jgi:hypothetical protein
MAAGPRESEPVSRTLAGPADGPDVVVNLIRRWFTATFIPRGTTTPTPGARPMAKPPSYRAHENALALQ